MKRYRPVLPGPASSSSLSTPPPQPGPKTDKPQKRVQISVACNACRERKLRCTGERPQCANCSGKNIACTYDTDPGTTRAEALRRRQADLEGLVDLLRSRPPNEAYLILTRLRSGEDVADLLRYVQSGALSAQSYPADASLTSAALLPAQGGLADTWPALSLDILFPDLDPWQMHYAMSQPGQAHSEHANESRNPPQLDLGYSIGQLNEGLMSNSVDGPDYSLGEPQPLIDDRLVNVRPQLWTKIKVSNIVMANLISIYLSWLHKFHRYFDERFFIDDLLSGKGDFCSPLLVNAICAASCMMIELLDPIAKLLFTMFSRQASSEWSSITGRPGVTAVSAAPIISMYTFSHLEPNRAMGCLLQGYNMAKELGIFRLVDRHDLPPDRAEAKLLQAKAVAGWGLFGMSSQLGLYYPSGPPIPRPPSLPPTFIHRNEAAEDWLAWPHLPAHPFAPSSRYAPFCTLSTLINNCSASRQRMLDAAHVSRTQDDTFAMNEAIGHLQKLSAWAASLDLQYQRQPRSPPYILDMHMIVYAALLEVFRPFMRTNSFASQIFISSLRQIQLLLRQMKQWWGGKLLLYWMMGVTHKVAFSSLLYVQPGEEADSFFHLCAEILSEQSQGCPLSGRVLQATLIMARQRGIVLSDQLEAMLKRLGNDPSLTIDDDPSTFSIDLEAILTSNPAAATMESLISQYKELNVSKP